MVKDAVLLSYSDSFKFDAIETRESFPESESAEPVRDSNRSSTVQLVHTSILYVADWSLQADIAVTDSALKQWEQDGRIK